MWNGPNNLGTNHDLGTQSLKFHHLAELLVFLFNKDRKVNTIKSNQSLIVSALWFIKPLHHYIQPVYYVL